MSLTTNSEFSCPYCMEVNDIEVDLDNDINQQLIVDCQICCCPIEITITTGLHDPINIIATTDSE
ncbi:CPXCG motif-containing cysteine-rich protein [Paraglaciecola aquimarina]|uniref:CPXCG motif-containing cysteine-rich protein n=1 Tax=Paraglaciecola aquimarina TaxID=1235557 RepID=A0ABU3SRQ7_9ALTE|nr:CPXCG motif-containing cysteine-rich protein [Paraglaciecola aquimarina]MDU0352671.1 CPXCG motif-containing cysteine-rich protein [Paraglaciecola aquimarina]